MMTRWGSSAGGIQTVNRELACAVKLLDPSIDCVAVVTTASAEEKENARLRGVTLVAGDSPDDWTGALLSEGLAAIPPHEVLAVIGHSYFSGQQALSLRKRFFEHALTIHFVHMSPMDTEALKEYRSSTYISEREKRQKLEVHIASKADVVACIGPRLWRYFHDQLISGFKSKKTSDVIRIDCGLTRSEEERIPPLERTVLCLGRTDSVAVKGIDLFARAAGHVARELPKRAPSTAKGGLRFVVRGVKDDSEGATLEKRLKELAKEAGGTAMINVRPYTTDAEELRSDYRRATAFVMPSREEGFGLVACEALSLGVPVVISSNSGLAEAIDEMADAASMTTTPCIVSHDTDDDDSLAQRYAEAILKILLDVNASNDYARLLRERLLQSHSWEAGARQLLQCIGTPRSDRTTQPSQATGVTLIQTAADVLRRNHDLLRLPGVVAAGVSHAIVVSVQKGSTAPIPKQLEGIDVIVRELENVQPTGAPPRIVSSGDAVLIDGVRRARVGLLVINRAGGLYATTATHVLPKSALSKIAIVTATGLVECEIARSDRSSDLTLLSLTSSERFGEVVSPAEPSAVQSVELALPPNRRVAGVISAFEMTMRIGGDVMEDLIEVRITSGEVYAGDSGTLVFDSESKRPVGTLVAVARFGDGGVHAYATTLERGLRALDVQALSAGSLITESVARTSGRGAHIAFMVDPITSPEMLRTLRHVSREQFGSNVYFVGDIGPRGVRTYVHTLSQSGNLTAAVAATNMLRDYRIDLMVVVGIAGGVRDVRVGDVVVSSEIIYYEPAKITFEGTDPRYRIVGLTPRWLTDMARSLSATGDLPRIHIGPIASGEKVLTVREAIEERLGRWGWPLAVEMEGAGVAEAVAAVGKDVPVVIVRGIADILDMPMKRTDDQRTSAVQAAIRVATALVSEFSQRDHRDRF